MSSPLWDLIMWPRRVRIETRTSFRVGGGERSSLSRLLLIQGFKDSRVRGVGRPLAACIALLLFYLSLSSQIDYSLQTSRGAQQRKRKNAELGSSTDRQPFTRTGGPPQAQLKEKQDHPERKV
ncbi:hypothetical protein BJX64DRAFT_54166 [Aspergillus heterothallicus]